MVRFQVLITTCLHYLTQIYEAVVVSRLSSPEQVAYDELSALDSQADLRSKRRNDLDALDRHRMVSPGTSVLKIRNELIEQANFTYAFILLTIFLEGGCNAAHR